MLAESSFSEIKVLGNPVESRSIEDAERSFFEKVQLLLKKNERKSHHRRKRQHSKICGVDASYGQDNSAYAVASVLDSKDHKLLEHSEYSGHAAFPYVPGLFFLREGPFVCAAVSKLKFQPDLVCFDAQGLAHPRGMGLATICGMVLGIPSVGVSKTRLVGETEEYKQGIKKLVKGDALLGFVTTHPSRYWSPGFSVTLGELEQIIEKHGSICIQSIQESHRRAGNMRIASENPKTGTRPLTQN
ncbi:MAG: endonuclease V [Thaumarchaeota archaeon]|nr:endonuclease V [Nitrososphaerota archaeon]